MHVVCSPDTVIREMGNIKRATSGLVAARNNPLSHITKAFDTFMRQINKLNSKIGKEQTFALPHAYVAPLKASTLRGLLQTGLSLIRHKFIKKITAVWISAYSRRSCFIMPVVYL